MPEEKDNIEQLLIGIDYNIGDLDRQRQQGKINPSQFAGILVKRLRELILVMHTINSEIKILKSLDLCKCNSKAKFTPPTIQEVIEYFIANGSTQLTAEQFYLFYDSKGWKVGKNPMKSWKSAGKGWILRNRPASSNTIKREGEYL